MRLKNYSFYLLSVLISVTLFCLMNLKSNAATSDVQEDDENFAQTSNMVKTVIETDIYSKLENMTIGELNCYIDSCRRANCDKTAFFRLNL